MKKIIKFQEIENLVRKIREADQTVVLVGGCFDILHFGHIKFLKKAKNEGDVLIVALESDENIKRLKGNGRPIHSQNQRAEMLASLEFVDLIICLPLMKDDKDYFELVKKIKPDVLAVTKGDPQLKNKGKQAKEIGAKVKIVTPYIKTASTTKLIKLMRIKKK